MIALTHDISFRFLIPYLHFCQICQWIDLRSIYKEILEILSLDTMYRALYQPITSNIYFELYLQRLANGNTIEGTRPVLIEQNKFIDCGVNDIYLHRILRKSSMKSSQLKNTHPDIFIKFHEWLCDPFRCSISYENFYLSWRYFITDFRNPNLRILSNHRVNRFLFIICKYNDV